MSRVLYVRAGFRSFSRVDHQKFVDFSVVCELGKIPNFELLSYFNYLFVKYEFETKPHQSWIKLCFK